MRRPEGGIARWARGVAAPLALALALAAPGVVGLAPLAAQSELEQVERFMAGDRYVEARDLLARWWDTSADEAPRADLRRGLWLRALLTIDPVMAETDYRRLVLEFPGGEEAAWALMRLAQGADFAGDADAAVRYLELLLRDYPAASQRVEARALLSRIERDGALDRRPALPAGVAGPGAGDRGAVQDTVAARDTLAGPPDTARTLPPPDSVLRPPPDSVLLPPPDSVVLPPPEGTWTVQLGAFSEAERARAFAAELVERGIEARVVLVEGSPLFRVRTGVFVDQAGAQTRRDVLGRMGLEGLVAGDRDRERTPSLTERSVSEPFSFFRGLFWLLGRRPGRVALADPVARGRAGLPGVLAAAGGVRSRRAHLVRRLPRPRDGGCVWVGRGVCSG